MERSFIDNFEYLCFICVCGGETPEEAEEIITHQVFFTKKFEDFIATLYKLDMSLGCIPDCREDFLFFHPINQEFCCENLRVHKKRVVSNYLIQVFNAVDPSFKEFRIQAFVTHF